MGSHPTDDHANQFSLLRRRRFAPFFRTQFLGAGNDNLFKFAFTVMATYPLQVAWMPPAMAMAELVIGALLRRLYRCATEISPSPALYPQLIGSRLFLPRRKPSHSVIS